MKLFHCGGGKYIDPRTEQEYELRSEWTGLVEGTDVVQKVQTFLPIKKPVAQVGR